MKQVYIKTFGCQMNAHDSERVLGLLREEGYSPVYDPESADLIVFNTCSIRQKAEQKFYSMLGRTKHIKKINPSVKIAVMGCIAQQEGREMKRRAPFVDHIIGPQNISRVGEALSHGNSIYTNENPNLQVTDLPANREHSIKALVNIMYGCNNYCSYCVVPYTRGRERSRPSANIIEEIKALAMNGYKEVKLLGQNVNSFNSDVTFPELLCRINDIEGIERIRFITSHPKDLDEELVKALKDLDKVCEHIHLPLQSGSTGLLSLMNRKYSYEDYLQRVAVLQSAIPGIAITTDIIAGFPGETDEDHRATVSALNEIEFDGIFAFKYSPRPMTEASKMEGHIDEEVKSARLAEVLETQDEITLKKNRLLEGKNLDVLIEERDTDIMYSGRTRSNKIVTIQSDNHIKLGSLINVFIEKAQRHSLTGTLTK
jgi:tRNA-2-methylthio-N6-dimethylallyladenosine synthase